MPSQSVGAFVATGRTPGTRPTLSLDVSGPHQSTGTAQAVASHGAAWMGIAWAQGICARVAAGWWDTRGPYPLLRATANCARMAAGNAGYGWRKEVHQETSARTRWSCSN